MQTELLLHFLEPTFVETNKPVSVLLLTQQVERLLLEAQIKQFKAFANKLATHFNGYVALALHLVVARIRHAEQSFAEESLHLLYCQVLFLGNLAEYFKEVCLG